VFSCLCCRIHYRREEIAQSRDFIDFGEVPLEHLSNAAVVIGYHLQEIEVLGQQIPTL
jgi:hypothetical protein